MKDSPLLLVFLLFYLPGCMIAALLALIDFYRAHRKRCGLYQRNLELMGYSYGLIEGCRQAGSVEKLDWIGYIWFLLGRVVWSWAGAAFLLQRLIARTLNALKAPARVREAEWKLANLVLNEDRIADVFLDLYCTESGRMAAAREAWDAQAKKGGNKQ